MGDGPFQQYIVKRHVFPNKHLSYVVAASHHLKTNFTLHNQNDTINKGATLEQRVLVDYQVNGESPAQHALYTFQDILDSYHNITNGDGLLNIRGEIGERIARRVMKHFLEQHSSDGHIGDLLKDEHFKTHPEQQYVLANNERYILKVDRYPTLRLLEKINKKGAGIDVYRDRAEIDGLFDYRYKDKQHIIVLESKLGTINADPIHIKNDLFTPLKELFPKAQFWYVLFTSPEYMFLEQKKHLRQLKMRPRKIHKKLAKQKINTMFFTFNETDKDFANMMDHLLVHYKVATNMDVSLGARVLLRDNHIYIFDRGQKPWLSLKKEADGRYALCDDYE
jgi:hypothetical protein